jgi:hypothetical protein
MVTGQKTILKNNNILNKNNALSIQISLSGLSFCILNRNSNTIEYLKSVQFSKKTTPFETLEQLITTLNTNTIFNQSFGKLLVIYQNELSNVVPKSLFDEQNCADYLKFNTKILNTDFITYDDLSIANAVNVFVPFVNINNYIFDRFGVFEYQHASTILVSNLLLKESNATETKLFINVSNHHFEIVAIEKGQLVFYNTFEYETKEDFIYYILFSIEQLKLDPETVVLKLMGTINKEDELYQIAYNYIRFIEFIEPFQNYIFDEKMQPSSQHSHYILLNSFN